MGQIRDTELLAAIALRIKQLRNEHGVTQEEVFNETNVHVGRIESEEANVSVSTLSVLCKYFKVSLSEFFEGM